MAGRRDGRQPPAERQPPRHVVRLVACPRCGAAAGEPCVRDRRSPVTGELVPRPRHHLDRVEVARGLRRPTTLPASLPVVEAPQGADVGA